MDCDFAVATAEIPQHYRTFKFRLLPNKRQHADLCRILEDQRQLYNAALESRISYYEKTGKSLSHFSMCAQLAELRRDPVYSNVPSRLQRWTLKRLDDAYGGFFGRLRRGRKAGFPRFRGVKRWQSFGFNEFVGIMLKGNRLHFRGCGSLRIHLHRKLPEGKLVSCVFTRDQKGWSVSLQFLITVSDHLPPTGKSVGVDMGLSSLAVLSTGEAIPNLRPGRTHERELRRRQRHLSRCRKGSNGRRKARDAVARLHLKIKNSRRTYLHQVSAKLVRENDLIAIEDLSVKGLANSVLAKSVRDAGWATLRQFITYKAAYAGRMLIAVDPKNTTQACSGCGVIVPKKISDRWHDCPECGLSLDRDHNAALMILGRSGSMSSQRKAEVVYA